MATTSPQSSSPYGFIPAEVDRLLSKMHSEIPPDADIEAFKDMVLTHYDDMVDEPEIRKCNLRAERLRRTANRLYKRGCYKEAMGKYNEAICYAEADSDHLGFCYANRSAIYYEKEEYELALLNMAIARANNYPEHLNDKLVVRERSCRKRLEAGYSKNLAPCPRMGINVEVNPQIPFLAKGIAMKEYSWCGRGLVAERDFQTGDVILDEKIMLSSVDVSLKYYKCSSCSAENQQSLIPCPNCVHAMYCSEECRERDKQFVHRFECGMATKLQNISLYTSNMGPKLFLYGLTVFHDDFDRMMEFCEQADQTVGDPFTLNYREYDPLAEFKELYKCNLNAGTDLESTFKACAALSYAVFSKHPSIQSHLVTNAHHRFLLKILLRLTRTACFFMWNTFNNPSKTSLGQVTSTLNVFGSIVNHSCDPNVVAIIMGGRLKLILLRPILAGEQILTAYGPTWYDGERNIRFYFQCTCPFCRQPSMKHWLATGRRFSPRAMRNVFKLVSIFLSEEFNDVDKLNAFRKFIDIHSLFHPEETLSRILFTYRQLLLDFTKKDIARMGRDTALMIVFG